MTAQSCHTCTVSVECQRICMHRHRVVRVGATGVGSDAVRRTASMNPARPDSSASHMIFSLFPHPPKYMIHKTLPFQPHSVHHHCTRKINIILNCYHLCNVQTTIQYLACGTLLVRLRAASFRGRTRGCKMRGPTTARVVADGRQLARRPREAASAPRVAAATAACLARRRSPLLFAAGW